MLMKDKNPSFHVLKTATEMDDKTVFRKQAFIQIIVISCIHPVVKLT